MREKNRLQDKEARGEATLEVSQVKQTEIKDNSSNNTKKENHKTLMFDGVHLT